MNYSKKKELMQVMLSVMCMIMIIFIFFFQREAKFSSFFKSLIIELDKDLYGPDNYLVEWRKVDNMPLPEGFKVKRTGDKSVKCKILLWLDYQPSKFKLDTRLARLLGVHTQSKCMVISSLWQYIKTHKLQVRIFLKIMTLKNF